LVDGYRTMSIITETILQEIKKKKFYSSYFLSGENEYMVNEIVASLKHEVLNPGFESFDFERYDAGENAFDMGTLKRSLCTAPMASLKRLIILEKVDKLVEMDRKQLLTFLTAPVDSTILVMIAISSKKVKSAFLDKLRKLSRSEGFGNLRRDSLQKWIVDYVRKRESSIEKDAILVLMEYAGNNQLSLSGELDKMITLVGKKKVIKRSDSLSVLTSNMVHTVFDLTDAVGRREREKALAILVYLLGWGEPPEKILAILRILFIRLKGILFYKRKGLLNKDIARKLGTLYFVINREAQYSKYFSIDELKDRLHFLYRAEVRVKTGEEAHLVLTDLVYNLI